MIKVINIKYKNAIDDILIYKSKKLFNIDVKFENVHLKELNRIIGRDIFFKNDLYINSDTLWELMQPIGGRGSHNYHQLTPKDILEA